MSGGTRNDGYTSTMQNNIPNAKASLSLLAYFRQIYGERVEVNAAGETETVTLTDAPLAVEALHLAWSADGRHWTALNGNRPILPGVWMRDPFVNRGPDGFFHLVATGGETQRDCLHLRSRDLIHWDSPRSLPLMAGIGEAKNVWAPEWFFDAAAGDYFLHWSSSLADAGWKNSRLWSCRTRDWVTFTPAEVLFEPPYSVIDGTLRAHDGTFYLFHKEEEFGARRGERRAIRLASAPALEGPYTLFDGPLNRGAHGGQIVPIITEGPAVMPDPLHPGDWLMLYDFCMSNEYGVSRSPDLREWEIEDDVEFPANARHGSVFPVAAAALERLQAAFPSV
jgi:hypothetical protein